MDLCTSSSGLSAATLAFLDILLKVIALIVVPNNRKPSSANAWLLAIFFVPLIGLPLYLILGKSVLSKIRNKKQKYITNKIKKISIEKAKYRLFIDKNEMARGLFVCFIKRNIKPMPEYLDLFRNSQHNNPELWI